MGGLRLDGGRWQAVHDRCALNTAMFAVLITLLLLSLLARQFLTGLLRGDGGRGPLLVGRWGKLLLFPLVPSLLLSS